MCSPWSGSSRSGRTRIFIQSESSEYFHAENPAAIKPAEIMNARRFLSLDLNYGRRVDSEMYEFLMDNGMTPGRVPFLPQPLVPAPPLHHGKRLLRHQRAPGAGGRHRRAAAGDVFGYDEITRQYYDRYRLPVMHTETNLMEGPNGDEAVNWLWKQWANVLRVRNTGVPIVGFTWYSLTDQMDWDMALREENNRVTPVGLYDLDRNIRPVGRCYKQLIEDWCDVLPAQSVCLTVPVVRPQDYDEAAGPPAPGRELRRRCAQQARRKERRHEADAAAWPLEQSVGGRGASIGIYEGERAVETL